MLGWILSAIGTFPVERGKDNGKAIEMAKNVIDTIKKEDQDDVDDVEIEIPEE